MRLAALVSVIGLAVTTAHGTPASGVGPPVVTCESIIDTGGATDWRPKRIVLGVIAVPPAHIPQTVATGEMRWRFWSKAGLVVRAGSPPVTITVPKTWRQRVAIGWGDAGGFILRIATCADASTLGGWNPYSGGFRLKTRSACVPLTFRVGERTATVRFGVGKRCS
jgi:hypothetical protein